MRLVALRRRREEIPLAVVFGGVVLLALLAARIVVEAPPALVPAPIFCPFRSLTGFPCPTCGGTRALAALLSGDLAAALRFNPLMALSALGILAAAGASLARRGAGRPALRLRIEPRERALLRALAGIAVLANWIYLLIGR